MVAAVAGTGKWSHSTAASRRTRRLSGSNTHAFPASSPSHVIVARHTPSYLRYTVPPRFPHSASRVGGPGTTISENGRLAGPTRRAPHAGNPMRAASAKTAADGRGAPALAHGLVEEGLVWS